MRLFLQSFYVLVVLTVSSVVFVGEVSRLRAEEEPPKTLEEAMLKITELQRRIAKLESEKEKLSSLLKENGIVPGNGFQSIVELLGTLPAEMQSAQKLDKFSFDDVAKKINQDNVGEWFETTLQAKTLRSGKNPYASSSTAQAWMGTVYLERRDFKHRGFLFTQTIEGAGWPDGIRLFGDEKFIKEFERLKPGVRVTVKGRIREIAIGREQNNRRDVTIKLSDLVLKIPGLSLPEK